MKVITEEYRKLQQELHHNPNYGVASLQFAPIVADIIKDLNVALGKTEIETEEIIKAHYFFKKDRLDFDWKQGVMLVGGTYTEVWD